MCLYASSALATTSTQLYRSDSTSFLAKQTIPYARCCAESSVLFHHSFHFLVEPALFWPPCAEQPLVSSSPLPAPSRTKILLKPLPQLFKAPRTKLSHSGPTPSTTCAGYLAYFGPKFCRPPTKRNLQKLHSSHATSSSLKKMEVRKPLPFFESLSPSCHPSPTTSNVFCSIAKKMPFSSQHFAS